MVILGVFVGIVVLLNFVPIKFAVKIDDIMLDDHTFVCDTIFKTGIFDKPWEVYTELPLNHQNNIVSGIEMDGVLLEFLLAEKLNIPLGSPNKFLITGTLTEEESRGNLRIATIKAEAWEIIYPITRKHSIRNDFLPKGYLTIYDFNLKELWNKQATNN